MQTILTIYTLVEFVFVVNTFYPFDVYGLLNQVCSSCQKKGSKFKLLLTYKISNFKGCKISPNINPCEYKYLEMKMGYKRIACHAHPSYFLTSSYLLTNCYFCTMICQVIVSRVFSIPMHYNDKVCVIPVHHI